MIRSLIHAEIRHNAQQLMMILIFPNLMYGALSLMYLLLDAREHVGPGLLVILWGEIVIIFLIMWDVNNFTMYQKNFVRSYQRYQLLPLSSRQLGMARLIKTLMPYLALTITFVLWMIFIGADYYVPIWSDVLFGMTAVVLNGIPLRFMLSDLVACRLPPKPDQISKAVYMVPGGILMLMYLIAIGLMGGLFLVTLEEGMPLADLYHLLQTLAALSRYAWVVTALHFIGVGFCLLSLITYRHRRSY